ncbi:response regulator [Desulfovibrio inopinatus]|uniref:response regulator n=1 Tax=Desulfovibrio inopinatus TaxID=102109 RepID=UPI00041F0CAA|nr:PleD family two-component system response regulator [Desulfovibrio inopinatus]
MPDREHRPKILIVDDEKTNIDVIVGLLNTQYKTVVALNGEQALKRLERPPLPDLILLDIMMPGMDGYEVCRLIKENPTTRHIPVIFITGKSDEQDEAKGFQAGAVDYITKPFSPIIGMARVNTHIELKRRGDMLEKLAGLDGLTGIPNRRRFNEYLEAEWKRAYRHHTPLSLLLLDIDYFKLYNDYYGHLKGDGALKRIAEVLSRTMLRQEDLAARYGGEEFACILPQTRSEGATLLAQKILDDIRELKIPHQLSEVAEHVTVSIGISSPDVTNLPSPHDLVDQADNALYQAKHAGRNRYALFTPNKSD